MSEAKWSDTHLDRHLRSLTYGDVLPGAPAVSTDLRERTRAAWEERRASLQWREVLWKCVAAAAAAVCLSLVSTGHFSLAGVAEMIFGIPVRVLNMSREEWLREGFRGWLAQGPDTEFFSPEETAGIAPFPIRTPQWLPEGFEVVHEPIGAYSWGHYPDEGWKVVEDEAYFFVTQSFRADDGQRLSIIQSLLVALQGVDMPPGTERLEVAGHPAFLRQDVPLARADEENERRSRLGLLPEIVGYENQLEVWVSEDDGQITRINVFGALSPETLIRVAESLFDDAGGAAQDAE